MDARIVFVECVKKFVNRGYKVSNYSADDFWFNINIDNSDGTFEPDYYINKHISSHWKVTKFDNYVQIRMTLEDVKVEPMRDIYIVNAISCLCDFIDCYLINYEPILK